MTRQFIPRKSGAHRIACIALYRALLSQCARIQLPAESFRGSVNPIRFQIRKQFQRNKDDTSSRLVVAALKVGYEAEELLRTAGDGVEAAHSKVLGLLREIHAEGDAARLRNAGLPTARRERPPPQPKPYPGAVRVIDVRPRPKMELSGRRHVPVLVNANSLPMLRFKKPQSTFLNRVLLDRIKRKQRQVDGIDRAQVWMDWGRDEDEWDRLLPLGPEGTAGHTWSDESRRAKKDYEKQMMADIRKNKVLAQKFLAIVDREKELALQERKERKRERDRERKERRQQRRQQGTQTPP
ncbi:MAG: hypothetical protein M1818_008206 [Claussenomyces sp. TS43310]|nr:MAG: hypothetical protein M1818_008206 [Claussenomyces sp. TS43310]